MMAEEWQQIQHEAEKQEVLRPLLAHWKKWRRHYEQLDDIYRIYLQYCRPQVQIVLSDCTDEMEQWYYTNNGGIYDGEEE